MLEAEYAERLGAKGDRLVGVLVGKTTGQAA